MPRKEGASPEKARYFSSLAQRNFSSTRLLRDGDCLRVRVINPDTGLKTWQDIEDRELWRNVSEHCLVQTAGVGILAEELGLPEESRVSLQKAALLHDWDKKHQTTELRKINGIIESGEVTEEEGGKLKYDFFEESEEHSVSGMRERNISEDIIKIASADGHPALPRVMDPNCAIEEKILHYVGSITDESRIVALDERVDNLERNERYKMMNEYGRQVPWTNGRALYEVQRTVGHQIEAELAQRLIDSGNLLAEWQTRLQRDPKELPIFIRVKIEEKYAA